VLVKEDVCIVDDSRVEGLGSVGGVALCFF
jgi:hypothetical protein